MKSLYAKFQLSSFKTEGGVSGDRRRDVRASVVKIYPCEMSKHLHLLRLRKMNFLHFVYCINLIKNHKQKIYTIFWAVIIDQDPN